MGISTLYHKHICACGCGGKIEVKSHHFKKGYKIPKYILGHHNKTKEYKKQISNDRKGKPSWNKGKKCPQISKSKMGEKNPMYGKTGKYNPNFGKKASDETRKKQSEKKKGENNPKYWSGKHRYNSTKKLISKNCKGKNLGSSNGNWKGGISFEPYCDQWADKDYKESIKERDDYKCLNPTCNKLSQEVCIHHINYIKKDCHPFNLITICFSCNAKANKDRKWHTAWYTAIIERRYYGNSGNRQH